MMEKNLPALVEKQLHANICIIVVRYGSESIVIEERTEKLEAA
jgi:hypothetical protein